MGKSQLSKPRLPHLENGVHAPVTVPQHRPPPESSDGASQLRPQSMLTDAPAGAPGPGRALPFT